MQENTICVDWLTFVSKSDSTGTISDLLGLMNVDWQPIKGRNGYRDGFTFEHINIYYNGTDDMGICVDISGQGCRALETYSKWFQDGCTFANLLGWILQDDYHVTRLDIAMDERDGILDMGQLLDDTDDHHYRSKSKWWLVEYGSPGTTIYHGSPKSDFRVRIYDKAAQLDLHEHWVRVEMQLRDDNALGFIKALSERNVGEVFTGVLRNHLCYVEPVGDTNMSRWPLAPYWAKLLAGAEKISCWACNPAPYTIGNLQNVVINQIGNAVDTYLYIFGIDDLISQLGQRSIRLSPKYQRLRELKDKGLL